MYIYFKIYSCRVLLVTSGGIRYLLPRATSPLFLSTVTAYIGMYVYMYIPMVFLIQCIFLIIMYYIDQKMPEKTLDFSLSYFLVFIIFFYSHHFYKLSCIFPFISFFFLLCSIYRVHFFPFPFLSLYMQ